MLQATNFVLFFYNQAYGSNFLYIITFCVRYSCNYMACNQCVNNRALFVLNETIKKIKGYII